MEGSSGDRIPLGEITNVNGKRGLPLVPGKFIIGHGNRLEDGQIPSESVKRVRKGSGELFGGGEGVGNSEDGSWKTWNLLEFKKVALRRSLESREIKENSHKQDPGNGADSISSAVKKKGKFPRALNPGVHLIRGGGAGSRQDDESVQRSKDADVYNTVEQEARKNGSLSIADDRGCYTDECGLSQSSLHSMEQEDSAVVGIGKLTRDLLDKGHVQSAAQPSASSDRRTIATGEFSLNAEASSDRPCSCQICLRGSWLVADVLSQDYRGRLIEVKKSRRAAAALVGRRFVQDPAINPSERSTKCTKLECDIMERWRSLFVRTENLLHLESSKLQANMVKFHELKTNCERDFEEATGMSSSHLFTSTHNPD